MKTALFCGSFDPIHDGHIDVIESVLENPDIDKVLIAVCTNPSKKGNYHLSLEKAAALVKANIRGTIFEDKTFVFTSSHSMVNICLDFGCDYIIRGYRTEEERRDEEEKFNELDHLFLKETQLKLIQAYTHNYYLSSTRVRNEIWEYLPSRGISHMTHSVMQQLLNNKTFIAVVGDDEETKEKLCKQLARGQSSYYNKKTALHEVLNTLTPGIQKLREKIENNFKAPIPTDVDELDKYLSGPAGNKITDELFPYISQHWRRFCKKSRSEIVLVNMNSFKAIEGANGFTIVVGNDSSTNHWMETVHNFREDNLFGQAIHFPYNKDDPKFNIHAGDLIVEVRRIIEENKNYEANWSVPDHETALRRFLR